MRQIKVLLCESSGRQVLPMAKAFSKLGCEVTTVQGKRNDLGAVTRYAQKKYIVSGVDNNHEIARDFYSQLLHSGGFDLVVPLSDFSAEIIATLKEEVEKNTNTKVATNDLDVFMNAYDKLNTMQICMENKIVCPHTFGKVNSIEDIPMEVTYPLLLKPRSSCGSIGLHIANNRKELSQYIEQSKKEDNREVLVQEFIPQHGKQYNAHFFIDDKGVVKTALLAQKCRWFPLDGGASTLCKTVHNEEILNECAKLLNILKWKGYCDIDLMEDPRDGRIHLIEINARISANVKLCFASGINIAKQILNLYMGDVVENYDHYSDDMRLRCIHTDLLWFIKSPNRFETIPGWFSFKNTTDQIFSLDDPIPFIIFSWNSLFKYKQEMKKRER